LKADISHLKASGDTALFDATFNGILTLEASGRGGKRAVLVLTDGKDTNSHRRVDDVIKAAQQTHTPLHMLGLGTEQDIDRKVMERMAAETGGTFHHVQGSAQLIQIFEQLSIDLHDEGIDEASLRALAEKTGGKYFLARDVSQLRLHFGDIAQELQTTFSLT